MKLQRIKPAAVTLRLFAILALAACGRGQAAVIFSPTNASWRLLKGWSEASVPDRTAWRQPNFDDSGWSVAPAPIFYTLSSVELPFYAGGPATGTVIDDMFTNYTSIFFRKTFVISDVAGVDSITVEASADDGFVLWLNGTEVARTNMPAGFVPFNGRALVSASEPVPVLAYVLSNAAGWLREGTNVLAAQGFNWDPGSSDFGFIAGLSLSRAGTNGSSGCSVAPTGIAAWWPLNRSGESMESEPILAFSGGPVFAAGKVAQGIELDGIDDSGRAPASSRLNVGGGAGLTIEGWIKPADASRLANVVEWNNGMGGIGVHLSTSVTGVRDFYANLVDTGGASHQIFTDSGALEDDVFQHIALTYERGSGVAALYINGDLATQAGLGVFTPQTSYNFFIGTRVSGPFSGMWFAGSIDELTLYDRAITDVEIRSIFAASMLGKCFGPRQLKIIKEPVSAVVALGGTVEFSVEARSADVINYQWRFNDTPLPGATSTILRMESVQAAQSGRYSVTVSDGAESLNSSTALLTVMPGLFPVITEFMAENRNGLTDEDGDHSDWVEIFNPGPGDVNLENWCLTDDRTTLAKWRFPSTSLGAGSYLVVFASGKDRRAADRPLHTNFKLDESGEYLALVWPGGVNIASEFSPVFPPQRPDVSYGLSGGTAYFPAATPRAINNTGVLGFLADTKFSTNRGFFFAPIDVTIDCATPGATIVYTTNGDVPSASVGVQVPSRGATLAPQAIVPVSRTSVLRATALKDGWMPTGVDTHTYIFPSQVANQVAPSGAATTWVDDPPGNGSASADFTVDASVVANAQPGYRFTNALLSVPTISIVTPSDGLFGPANGIYTHAFLMGSNWERRASAELIFPDRREGREGFHLEAGLRMHGAVSRLNAIISKHPLRLTFREQYGAANLDYSLFTNSPVRRFDHLVLRACSTDAWAIQDGLDFLWRSSEATYQRDQWMRDTHLAMGHPSARGLYVQLYLNGLYWGLYNLTERMSDSFFAAHLGGGREEYDAITFDYPPGVPDGKHIVAAGDDVAWLNLISTANLVPSNPSKYWEIQGLNSDGTRNTNSPVLLDRDNFIDYMMLHIYAPAVDWPNRNWWAARRRGAKSAGFHFFVWDQEVALDRLVREITWATNDRFEEVDQPDSPAQIYDRLRRNAEFKVHFADRLQKHMYNSGALTVESNRVRWATRAAEIDQAIVGESARWGDSRHSPAYTRQADWLRMSNFTQIVYWPSNRVHAWQRFRNVDLYPSVGPASFNQFGGVAPPNFHLILSHTNATGLIYVTSDGGDPRLIGGGVSPGALIYSNALPISAHTVVKARVLVGSTWSALTEAEFYVPQDYSALQVTEIHYNPRMFDGTDGERFEFLELQNCGKLPLNLSGLFFSAGLDYTLSNGVILAPDAYCVLVNTASNFARIWPGTTVHGEFSGKLDNGGERLTLTHPLGFTVFSFRYEDEGGWPAAADGAGASLQRFSACSNAAELADWVASTPTPGAAYDPASDTDADGLPDVWEFAHGTEPREADAEADPDRDGASNRDEYLAGTDPQDAGSALRIRVRQASNEAVELQFAAVTGRNYTILWTRDPIAGPWEAAATFRVVDAPQEIEFWHFEPEAPVRFYRIVSMPIR